MNSNIQATSADDAERRLRCILLKTAAMWIHRFKFYTTIITAQCGLIWETLGPRNMESIEFRLCASLLCLFVWLSIFSIWLLCKQCNRYNKPTNIYQPSVRPEGRDATTINEWEVTQLWLLIQGYLSLTFQTKIMYQLLISHKWTCADHSPIAMCWKCEAYVMATHGG